MSNKYIADFYPVKSLIHTMSPSIKMINLFILIFVYCLTSHEYILLASLFMTLVMIVFSSVPMKFYFKILFNFIYLYLIATIIMVLAGLDLQLVGIILLKIFVVLLNIIIIIQTTSANGIATGVMKIVNVFNIFFINMNKLGIRTAQTLKFLPVYYKSMHQILDSQASRGIDYKYVTFIGRFKAKISCYKRVFAITKEKLYIMGITMEQRLFNLGSNRLKPNLLKFNAMDFFFLGVHILYVVFFVTRIR